ncbi:MAG: hypothetical protein Q9162_006747 [Coniocarpon cinnabarinum]
MRWPWQQSNDQSSSSIYTASASLNDVINPNTLVATAVLTTLALGSARLYRTRLTRISTAPHIPPSWLHEDLRAFPRRHRIFGTVLRVSDGDGVRVFHTPGGRLLGWGWLRRIPSEPFPRQKRGAGGEKSWLSENTINVRLSGIDAPELAHFGNPGQPGAEEATERLKELALSRRVLLYPHVNDQYGRIVGTVLVKRWHLGVPLGLRRWVDAGAEVVRDGWATVYEGKVGVAFGGKKREELLRQLEGTAKQKRLGIWRGGASSAGSNTSKGRSQNVGLFTRAWRWIVGEKKDEAFESPREFKARMKKVDDAEKGKK